MARANPVWRTCVPVHAHGPLRIVDDPAWLRALVERLTARHEAGRPDPWQVTGAPADFIQARVRGIVGLEIPVTRLVGKWKVSQNRSPAARAGVVEGLRGQGDPEAAVMAELVRRVAR